MKRYKFQTGAHDELLVLSCKHQAIMAAGFDILPNSVLVRPLKYDCKHRNRP